MIPALVLLVLLVCDVTPDGWGDECETVEIRARSCGEAMAWARGWIPPGHGVAMAQCVEQRRAAR
jgi:hypothetical protein